MSEPWRKQGVENGVFRTKSAGNGGSEIVSGMERECMSRPAGNGGFIYLVRDSISFVHPAVSLHCSDFLTCGLSRFLKA